MSKVDRSSSFTFSLLHEGKTKQIVIKNGEVLFIGRGSGSAFVIDDLSISAKHVEFSFVDGALRARDCSRHGTSIRDPHPVAGSAAFGLQRRLSNEESEELRDGSEVVVPFKAGGKANEKEPSFRFIVRFTPRLTPAPAKVVVEQQRVQPHMPAQQPAGGGQQPNFDTSQLPDVFDPATKTGRWQYEARLGEGGLGVVYRAVDCVDKLGEVAIKVHKPRSKNHQRDARFIFELHRECQWSLWWLHQKYDKHYKSEPSKLFVRYLEDHTGFKETGELGFDAKRIKYEAPDFNWEKDGPLLQPKPYVVMELAKGEPLSTAIDREWTKTKDKSKVLTSTMKRELLLQAAQALEYLEPYELIHRDFRGCNMHVIPRSDGRKQLKVLDLGIMICASDGQDVNTNQAVQAFQKRGETEEKRKRYDWLPWEIRAGADGTGPAMNFAPPTHSFDVFSLGVLMLHMLIGRIEARAFLDSLQNNTRTTLDTSDIGIEPELLIRMLGEASGRPRPSEVAAALSPNQLASVPVVSSGAAVALAETSGVAADVQAHTAVGAAAGSGSAVKSSGTARAPDRRASRSRSRSPIRKSLPQPQPSVYPEIARVEVTRSISGPQNNPSYRPSPKQLREPILGLELSAALNGYKAMVAEKEARQGKPAPNATNDGTIFVLRYEIGAPLEGNMPANPAIGGLFV